MSVVSQSDAKDFNDNRVDGGVSAEGPGDSGSVIADRGGGLPVQIPADMREDQLL